MRLAVLSLLTRCDVLTRLALFISACASLACIQSSSSLAQITLPFYALCGKFISSQHPSVVSNPCSYSYIQCIHISHLFGNNAIRKGLFYSVTVLPTGPN